MANGKIGERIWENVETICECCLSWTIYLSRVLFGGLYLCQEDLVDRGELLQKYGRSEEIEFMSYDRR